jgi:hypothetical protein
VEEVSVIHFSIALCCCGGVSGILDLCDVLVYLLYMQYGVLHYIYVLGVGWRSPPFTSRFPSFKTEKIDTHFKNITTTCSYVEYHISTLHQSICNEK